MQVTLAPSAAVPEGASITVTCEDPAASPPTLYAWYHNSRWLQEGPSASLSIPVATRAHAGAYSCQVQDVQGTRSSRPTALQVLCEQGSSDGGTQGGGGHFWAPMGVGTGLQWAGNGHLGKEGCRW